MNEKLLKRINGTFENQFLPIETADSFPAARFDRSICRSLMEYVKDEEGFLMLSDLCGLDYSEVEQRSLEVPRNFGDGDGQPADDLSFDPYLRFSVVYNLYDVENGQRLLLEGMVPEDEPEIDSVTFLWKAARWYEREVWDMYGVKFQNHPDLKPVLLYEEFDGHPLRKDYPRKKRQPRPMFSESSEKEES